MSQQDQKHVIVAAGSRVDRWTGIVTAITTAIMAIVSVVVSFYAIRFSMTFNMQQLAATREHYRLSVMPLLDFSVVVNNKASPAGIFVTNDGFGPAIVNTFEIYVDGQRIQAVDLDETWKAAIDALNMRGMGVRWSWFEPGQAIRTGRSSHLFGFDNVAGLRKRMLLDAASRLEICIEYESIYGDRQAVSLKERYHTLVVSGGGGEH